MYMSDSHPEYCRTHYELYHQAHTLKMAQTFLGLQIFKLLIVHLHMPVAGICTDEGKLKKRNECENIAGLALCLL